MFRFFSARIGQQADLMRAYQWGFAPNPNLLLYIMVAEANSPSSFDLIFENGSDIIRVSHIERSQ